MRRDSVDPTWPPLVILVSYENFDQSYLVHSIAHADINVKIVVNCVEGSLRTRTSSESSNLLTRRLVIDIGNQAFNKSGLINGQRQQFSLALSYPGPRGFLSPRREKREKESGERKLTSSLLAVSLIAASWLFGMYFYVYYSVSYYIYMISI